MTEQEKKQVYYDELDEIKSHFHRKLLEEEEQVYENARRILDAVPFAPYSSSAHYSSRPHRNDDGEYTGEIVSLDEYILRYSYPFNRFGLIVVSCHYEGVEVKVDIMAHFTDDIVDLMDKLTKGPSEESE